MRKTTSFYLLLPLLAAVSIDQARARDESGDAIFAVNDCIIEPSKVVNVSSPVNGVLDQITVERGDPVEARKVIAQLESRVERAEVELARQKASFNQRKVKRNKTLYAKKLISLHDKDEMETEYLVSRLELRKARAVLAERTIKSPISGIVVERFFNEGEFVSNEPIIKIARINPLHVEVIVPVTALGKISKGMTADIYPQAPISGHYPAKVVIVDKIVDAASGTIRTRLLLPNPENQLPAGLKCRAEFHLVDLKGRD